MGDQGLQQYTTFLVDKAAQMATVRLHRRAKRNPINVDVMRDLDTIVRDLESDDETRVIVLTDQGRAFSAGADFAALREPLADRSHDTRTVREKQALSVGAQRVLTAWEALPQVTIAMVNGFAVGGGVPLMMSCDFRLAAERATMWIPEVELGIPYRWNSLARLIALVGVAKTRELVMRGDRLTAAEAERIGLVNRLVPDAELEAATMALARRLCNKPPLALQRTKDQINALTAMRSGDMSLMEPDRGYLCSTSVDGREARAAFFDKRSPTYQGRERGRHHGYASHRRDCR